jgi:hypothetical protein
MVLRTASRCTHFEQTGRMWKRRPAIKTQADRMDAGNDVGGQWTMDQSDRFLRFPPSHVLVQVLLIISRWQFCEPFNLKSFLTWDFLDGIRDHSDHDDEHQMKHGSQYCN